MSIIVYQSIHSSIHSLNTLREYEYAVCMYVCIHPLPCPLSVSFHVIQFPFHAIPSPHHVMPS